jgi:hypothetical protein
MRVTPGQLEVRDPLHQAFQTGGPHVQHAWFFVLKYNITMLRKKLGIFLKVRQIDTI